VFSLQHECTTYIYNCQTLNFVLVYIPLNPLYCINSLSPNFGVFESLHKEKHINSTRKRVQSATQRIFRRKNRHNYLKIQRNCVKYILDRSVKNRHFETELNMSLEHSILGVWNCARCVQVYGLINEKCPTSMAWAGYYVHKYEVVTIVCKSWNRWHFGLIVAPWACDELTQTPFLEENRKQEKRDLRHLAYRPV
jgi:hypothetical protein